MLRKMTIGLIIILIIIIVLIPKKNNIEIVKINLKGNNIVTIPFGEKYKEDGYIGYLGKKNITSQINISSNINYSKPGVYTITYSYKNIDNSIIKKTRIIKIKDKPYYKENYNNIDNTSRGWWSGNKKDHTRPTGGADMNELKKYNAYFLGKNKKVIYLTFDEGSNETYVKEIVDVLNNNNVKATFFLCKGFMENNPDLIKHIANTGHCIGNHTDNHLEMSTLASENKFNEFLSEITAVEETYKKITGKDIDKVYRSPRGQWSYRELAIVKDLGYKSYFYSSDYYDFASDSTKEYALEELLKRYHNGAIYLMHPKNKGNYLALNDFIKEMKKLGFSFDLVKNI